MKINILYRCFLILLIIIRCSIITQAQTQAAIQLNEGNPKIIINGKEMPPFAYMSYLGEEKFYKEIAATGVHLYNIPSYLGDRGINTGSGIGPFRAPIWIGENQYDFTALEKDFEAIIASDASAKVIIRIYLDPPLWWEKLHPEASTQLPDGNTFRQSFASEKWRKATGKVLKDYVNWVLTSPYSKYLAGIHVAAGNTEEWFYHPKQNADINPVRTQAFRKWLKGKYKSVSALQKAWNNNTITFKTAVPADINKNDGSKGWRDEETEYNYIDTFRFHAEVMADNIAYFCKIVKDVSNRKLLTGAFYGYHYYLTNPRSGHGALAKLLNCPDLDYLSSPNVYNRVAGEDWPPMAAVQSIQLHGKLWLAENDTRTSITTLLKDRSEGIAPEGQYESGVWLGPKDMETSVAFLWKNSGRMLAYGYGGWWFDMWGGWFSDERLLEVIAKTQTFHSDYNPTQWKQMQPEVCVIVDEELPFWDKTLGSLTGDILSNRYPLGKTGTSYDLFLRSDLNVLPTDQYKVIWFLGLKDLKAEELKSINEWQQNGKTVMWTSTEGTTLYKPSESKEIYKKGKLKWQAPELRQVWADAGVHLYVNTDDVFYIGRNWLCLHSVEGGKREIELPFSAKVYDPIQNKTIAESTRSVTLDIAKNSTILLRIEPH